MLKENPQKRPNIYEVLREACHMQGKDVPVRDVSILPPNVPLRKISNCW